MSLSRFMPTPTHSWKVAALRAVLCLLLYLAGWLTAWLSGNGTAAWLFIAACIPGAWGLVLESWDDLVARRLGIHFLMLAAAVASAALGQWPEAALLLVLFSGSEALELFANHRTETALASLFHDTPRTALRLMPDGAVVEIPVDALTPGMVIRIQPGQLVPVDVLITSGESECDESSLTGEAIPVGKSPGAEAMGGTLNLSGLLTAEVLRPASQSALQQIMVLIRDAQQHKAHAQRFTDRFGTSYTTLVLAGCMALFLMWWLVFKLSPFRDDAEASAFRRAITVLIVASPCALVISVPSAILAAIARGARTGVIFRGGSSIEDLAKVDAVALDKTGTLTTGELQVEEVHTFSGDESALRHAAFNLARQSTHPLSRAIVRKFTSVDSVEEPAGYTNVPGSGVSGTLGGGEWRMGKRTWIAEFAPGLADEDQLERAPVHSEVWVAGPGTTGCLWLRDQPRMEAAALLAEMHAAGIRTIMLTGDRAQAARAVAELTGVQEVHAGLLPGQKTDIIRQLQKEGRHVAMVGDGVNDAPALTAADVGIAMGLRGSDAAREQADLVLARDRLDAFLDAWKLSRRAVRIMRQNVFVALGMAAGMVVVSIITEVPLWLGVLTHEGSTAVVVLNSLRLLLGNKAGVAQRSSPTAIHP
jgi:Cd2+/Zn2+-exporting ATPase